jgi:hypothetical protein
MRIETSGSTLEKEIAAFPSIKSEKDFLEVDKIGKTAVALIKEIDATFEPIKSKQYAAWKETCNQQNRHKAIPQKVRETADRLQGEYQAEKERIAKEEQLRQEKAARLAEERLRKIKEDQERAWREKEEAKRREAERLAAKGKEEEARLAQEAADKYAQKADARAEEAANVFVPATVVEANTPKVEGTKMYDKWEFEIISKAQMIKAALKNDMLLPILTIDEVQLRKLVEAYKQNLVIPGLRIYSRKVVARAMQR